MSKVLGIFVELKTENKKHAGTDDHIYIGVVGPGGGREFPLNVSGFNDFEEGTNVKYWLGEVWEGELLENARDPIKSHGSWNDPKIWEIELETSLFQTSPCHKLPVSIEALTNFAPCSNTLPAPIALCPTSELPMSPSDGKPTAVPWAFKLVNKQES